MNVVNFAEGILGINQTFSPMVAKCLRQVAVEEPDSSSLMTSVADKLDSGQRVDVPTLRQIGEKPIADTQRLFLSL